MLYRVYFRPCGLFLDTVSRSPSLIRISNFGRVIQRNIGITMTRMDGPEETKDFWFGDGVRVRVLGFIARITRAVYSNSYNNVKVSSKYICSSKTITGGGLRGYRC